MLTTAATYSMVSRNLTRELTTTASAPVVSREKDYYLSKIRDIKSIDDFMSDSRIYNFALKAFGLEDMSYAKAFVRKILEGGVTDSASLANKLTDTRYKDFATTFDFAGRGTATTSYSSTQQGTVDKYIRQTLEQNQGNANEGVRLALYFQRKASTITNQYSILADPALLKVALTTLNLPTSLSVLPIEKQAEIIGSKLDIKDLQDPEKLNKFLTRFTYMYDINNNTAATTNPALLLIGSPTSKISTNLLASLQSFRIGG
jgi:hypothetical protein